MAAYILYDSVGRESMFPFTLTRPVADCRLGILTLREKWQKMLGLETATMTAKYLSPLFPSQRDKDSYWINGGLLPDQNLIQALRKLPEDTSLVSGDHILVSRGKHFPLNTSLNNLMYDKAYQFVTYPWELFQKNGDAIKKDISLLKPPKVQGDLKGTQLIFPENVYIEEGAEIYASSINATEGPVYISKNALVMEGSHIRGPVSIGEGAVVKMGAKIYSGTTVGPHCVVGGEVKNSILFGYSNKAHDGYLGDSVIGEWCNLGAGTTCSNLKNTAGEIEIRRKGEQKKVGIKCGVFMGDFSRTAVQTRINSGTTIGVSAHLYEPDFPEKEVPNFYWNKEKRYRLDKALEHADNWMNLKGKSMPDEMKSILKWIFNEWS